VIIRRTIVEAGGLSAVALLFALTVVDRPTRPIPWSAPMRDAASRMASVMERIAAHRDSAGPRIDARADPRRTGLIGPESGELMTTIGHLEAKRTTAQPDAAALLVDLLVRAGVGAGDVVAIGASGSFPALLVGVLAAVEALDARPVAVLSLGASTWGATDEDFHLLDVYDLCRDAGLVDSPPAAVTLGGSRDGGNDFEKGVRDRLLTEIGRRGLLPGGPGDGSLAVAVERRMAVYDRPAIYVNIGGAWAGIGDHPSVLRLRPGYHRADDVPLPAPDRRGVLQAMAAAGVPVIHLLDMRGLANRHGLRWDPAHTEKAGSTPLRTGAGPPGLLFMLLTVGYAGGLLLISLQTVWRNRRGDGASPSDPTTSPARTW